MAEDDADTAPAHWVWADPQQPALGGTWQRDPHDDDPEPVPLAALADSRHYGAALADHTSALDRILDAVEELRDAIIDHLDADAVTGYRGLVDPSSPLGESLSRGIASVDDTAGQLATAVLATDADALPHGRRFARATALRRQAYLLLAAGGHTAPHPPSGMDPEGRHPA